jgi:hypothetical protein
MALKDNPSKKYLIMLIELERICKLYKTFFLALARYH